MESKLLESLTRFSYLGASARRCAVRYASLSNSNYLDCSCCRRSVTIQAQELLDSKCTGCDISFRLNDLFSKLARSPLALFLLPT